MSENGPLSQRSDLSVFLNGKFVTGKEAQVGVMTHALSYGTGCFEGIRGYWNEERQELYLFRLREHYERLHRSCRIMHINLPYSVDELIDITVELVRRNDFHENCYFRPFAYKSDEIIGVRLNNLTDHFMMTNVAMGDYVATTGLRCAVSSWRRLDDNMIPARAKVSGAYVNSALAKTEALHSGFDEAIMLSSDGHVSEGSAENIFLVFGNELVTPPPSENILLGVTRDSIMSLARRELDRVVRERVVDRTELYVADEILLCGTGAQIAPVIEVDHRPVGSGKIGPVAGELQRLYADVVRGKREEYMDWLTPVYGTSAKAETPSKAKATSNGNGHSQTSGKKTQRPAAAVGQ